MIVGINCGHTVAGPGVGAVGRISESVEDRNVGKELIQLLREGGHTVVDCTNDYAKSVSANLAEICRLANNQYLDLFVSLHFNAGGGRGTEVFTYGGRKFDAAVETCVNLSDLGFRNRGVKDGSNLYVLRCTNARAMLVEICFVDTDDANMYLSLGARKIAEALYEGITGSLCQTLTTDVKEYESVNDILWELNHRGILVNKELWQGYMASDVNVYWFCRKLCQYIRTKNVKENSSDIIQDKNDIIWDLNYRGIISDSDLWKSYCDRDNNVYCLLRNGLDYCRKH